MPALQRAHRLTERAAKVGFDWPDEPSVRGKAYEELAELVEAVDHKESEQEHIKHEVGDLLFAIVNWSRKLGFDPEEALDRANGRFIARFGYIERQLTEEGQTPSQASLKRMDTLWEEAKKQERS
jgi:uncharacterized protein YabN with tetrapyrrole methylase and pyrophosphatase domain